MRNFDLSLMYVTDDRITDDVAFFAMLEAALKGGATIIQLREKERDTLSFYQRAMRTKERCALYDIPLIINDRLDIALAVDADGVHIGQQDLPAGVTRKLLGKDKIIGLSVSNRLQAQEANALDVDYIGISPIFATSTKREDLELPLGMEGLRAIRKIYTKAITSIGGVHAGNVAEIMRNGSDGIAVVSAISKADDPELATQQLKEIICQTGFKT
ncbi:MAG: thiamine phosphate synthase [Bacteroidota bacterium]